MPIASRRSLLPRPGEKIVSQTWVLSWIGFFVLVVWLLPVLLGQPVALVGSLVFLSLAGTVVLQIASFFKLRKRVEARPSDSICTFARAFDFRRIDTRLIRAVYEKIQHECRGDHPHFPVRASDRWDKELGVVDEDLEDLIQIVAYRTRRSLDHPEQNPMYGHIETVSDLVLYLSHQSLQA